MGKPPPSTRREDSVKDWLVHVWHTIRVAAQTPIPRYLVETEMCSPKLQGVTLREYCPKDFEVCRELYELNAPGRFPADIRLRQLGYLREQGKTLLVAEFKSQVIGCGGLVLHNPDLATLVYGLVHPDFQRMGVGRLLFYGRVSLLPTLDIDTLIVIHAVRRSLSYYRQFGFAEHPHRWKDSAGGEHPSATLVVNAHIIQRARDYLRIVRVPCPDLGPLKPMQACSYKEAGAASIPPPAPSDGSYPH